MNSVVVYYLSLDLCRFTFRLRLEESKALRSVIPLFPPLCRNHENTTLGPLMSSTKWGNVPLMSIVAD